MLSAPESRCQAIECGRHSGIPRCCVGFFVGFWMWATDQHWMNAYAYHRWRDVAGYIQCPLCKLLRRPVRRLAECSCWFGPKSAAEWAEVVARARTSAT